MHNVDDTESLSSRAIALRAEIRDIRNREGVTESWNENAFTRLRVLMAAQRGLAKELIADQFSDISAQAAHALVRGGFISRNAVIRATDQELLTIPYFGKRLLADVRKVMPGPVVAIVPCPHCHGTGKVRQVLTESHR